MHIDKTETYQKREPMFDYVGFIRALVALLQEMSSMLRARVAKSPQNCDRGPPKSLMIYDF